MVTCTVHTFIASCSPDPAGLHDGQPRQSPSAWHGSHNFLIDSRQINSLRGGAGVLPMHEASPEATDACMLGIAATWRAAALQAQGSLSQPG